MISRWILSTCILVSGCLLICGPVSACQDEEQLALAIANTAIVSQNNGAYDFAAKEWLRLLEKYPSSSLTGKALFNSGICLLRTGEYAQAATQLAAAIPELKDDAVQIPQAKLYLGFAQLEQGRALAAKESTKAKSNELIQESINTFKALLDSHPKFDDADQACFFQGGAYEELGQQENALAAYKKMLDFPHQAFLLDGLFAIADLHDQLGQYDEARKYFEQFRTRTQVEGHPLLREVNLRAAKTMIRLALVDEQNGNPAAANKAYSDAASILENVVAQDAPEPTDKQPDLAIDANFQRAFCLRKLNQFETAAKLYQQVAEAPQTPFRDPALAYAGRSYLDAGNLELAESLLTQSTRTDSTLAVESAHVLAGLMLKQSRFEDAYKLATDFLAKAQQPNVRVPLLMDQADAAYGIADRRAESVQLFDAIVKDHSEHSLAPAAMYNSAFASLEQSDYGAAIATAEAFVKQFSDSDYLADTLEVKADAMLLDGQHAAAASAFEQLVNDTSLQKHLKRPLWQLRSGLALYLDQQYQATLDRLQPLVTEVTAADVKAEAQHWIGSSHFQLKAYPEAIAALQASLAADPNWRRADETMFTLCRSQLAAGQVAEARLTAADLIETFPKSAVLSDVYYQLGHFEYEAKRYAEALVEFDKVLQQFPTSPQMPFALYSAAWSQLELKKLDEADKLFTRLIDEFPTQSLVKDAKLARASIRRRQGNLDSSIADLDELLQGDMEVPQKTNALLEKGLTHTEAKQWADAVATFSSLVEIAPEDSRRDRFFYELAWAEKSQEHEAEAIIWFRRIVSEMPDSPFAPEANFHVGKQAYDEGQYDDAIAAFKKCVDSTADAEVREKAAYKLAWAFYKQEDFAAAQKAFADQVKDFPRGLLLADGKFMLAEALFRQKQYREAFAAYVDAKPVVDAATNIDEKLKWLTMLHGAQAANKAKNYDGAIELAKEIDDTDASAAFKQDVYLELGSAHSGLKQAEQAMKFWQLAAESLSKTGARAYCMIGDQYFREKKFAEATIEFKRVFFGFGGTAAAEDIQPWQAYARYEAARCSFVQVSEANAEAKPKLVADAIQHFEALLKNYPDDSLAPEARKQLESLKQLKLD